MFQLFGGKTATRLVLQTAKLGVGVGMRGVGPTSRALHGGPLTNGPASINPVALQMITYALSHARSHKSDESYGQSQIVLEQCLSTQPTHDSRALVFMAMSTLSSERGNYDEAIEKLAEIQSLNLSSLCMRVTAMEALAGLYLELGKDNTSSVLADKCLQTLQQNEPQSSCSDGDGMLLARAKAIKGLVELTHGNAHSAESFFQSPVDIRKFTGSTALSYGIFSHATQNFELAKEVYRGVMRQLSEREEIDDTYALGACNMSPEEVLLASMCALGQIEGQFGNFDDAEKMLTSTLTKAEEHFGSRHPKVGVVLTCIALMFRRKATEEGSSSLVIQEGLYRKALELFKAPPVEDSVEQAKVARSDMIALARGAYAELLCVQQKRKEEGEQMKKWAEAAWRNRRLSLAEALEVSEPASKTVVIDTRIGRPL